MDSTGKTYGGPGVGVTVPAADVAMGGLAEYLYLEDQNERNLARMDKLWHGLSDADQKFLDERTV